MKRVDVWWTSWESAAIGDFGGVLIILEISVDFQGVMQTSEKIEIFATLEKMKNIKDMVRTR